MLDVDKDGILSELASSHFPLFSNTFLAYSYSVYVCVNPLS